MLAVLFIALKLTGVIQWSWWWVLSPLWIALLLFVVIFVSALLVYYWLDRKALPPEDPTARAKRLLDLFEKKHCK
tara:strand:+ start:104 stop:328 length:225 start_codon:yes stop_codon:yes gene_type:complete